MKNYYEILEVDKKASQEVIEKAYRTLVKKYHPDLKNNEVQKEYEEKMKEINEAYSVLTDDYKKSTYDEQLENTVIPINEYKKVIHENDKLRNELNELVKNSESDNKFYNIKIQDKRDCKYSNDNEFQTGNTIVNMSKIMKEQIKRAYNNAYNDAYIQDMKDRGYKIKYNHDFKYYIKLIGCTIFIVLILALVYQVPIVKNFFNELYNQNLVFKAIVNIFIDTFSTKFF